MYIRNARALTMPLTFTLACLSTACSMGTDAPSPDSAARNAASGLSGSTGSPTEPPPPPAPRDCSAKDACGPAPLAAIRCENGEIVDYVCVPDGDACVWQRTECPAPPPPPPPPPPGAECGNKVCGREQTCCSGMPFSEPTCIDGTMCPISQRKFKTDIHYLSGTERARLTEELMAFRLATYRYKAEQPSEREHLGFIIDDVAPSAAVMASGERVDMYGYQTMAVAALQMQAREIAELRSEIASLKRAEARKHPSK